MRITIITQADPFYLGKNIQYLILNLPKHSEIVSGVILEVSPFGKKESYINKIIKTYKIFGLSFFIHYILKFIIGKLDSKNNVHNIFDENNIPVIKVNKGINHPETISKIKSFYPDLIISIAGNQIFKKQLIDLAPKGCLNIHTALLPKYRGLMPSFWVLKNKEAETGVSVFFVDEGIDSGPILVQKRISINPEMTQAELIKKSKKIGMVALVEAIELISRDNYELIPNIDDDMTYYSFPSRNDVISFNKAGNKFF